LIKKFIVKNKRHHRVH